MKKNKTMKIIILIAIIIIPVMYSFFYLKAFWDPYGNLKDMNVALVNLDEGNQNENLGENLINKLKDKDVMNFTVLNNQEMANSDLIDGKYYATITIPKNFTANLNNADKKDRNTVTITYSPNQKSNYLASQIIAKVVTSVETQLRGEINKNVVSSLSDKLNEVPDKLQTIADGSIQLENGSLTLKNGISTLYSGTNSLKSNYTDFNNGVKSCYDGSTKLNNGILSLSDGVNKLYSGSNTLNESVKNIPTLTQSSTKIATNSNNLTNGINTYVNTVNSSLDSVTSDMGSISTDIQALVATHPELLSDTNFQKLIGDLKNASKSMTGVSTLKNAGNNLKTNTSLLNAGIQEFNSAAQNLNNLPTGVSALANGIGTLKTGSEELKTGSQNLMSGLNTLNVNSSKVLDGITTLDNGVNNLASGSTELANGTTTFKNKINNGISSTNEELENLEGLDSYAENPIETNEEDYGKVTSYGIGFTPYFMSISLWVGALIMIIILYYDPADRFKKLGRNANNKFLRTALYAIIGVLQGIVLGFILKLCLRFDVTNVLLYYFTCILISLTFLSIIHFLLVYFKDIGKFLSILFLVLQLAASGGTFPIETVPKFFQKIYALMPMNYSIRLIKECIIQINQNMVIKNIIILLSITIFFFGLSFLIDFIELKKDKKQI